MSGVGRLWAESQLAWRAFFRRRTAVFFTFLFPILLVVIFGALVQTGGGDGGLFTEPAGYYVPGYLTVVVLFTPLTRIGSTVARYREGNRFEKLATTPLSRSEWLAAHTAVTTVIVAVAGGLVLGLVVLLTDARVRLGWQLLVFVAAAVTVFSGLGAVLGRVADSRDGVVAAANTVALPLLFLSETFVPLSLLPSWFRPLVDLSPVTYFARGVRAVTFDGGSGGPELLVLSGLAVVLFGLGAVSIPVTD
jgi:ABC-2 type transport system permease protein